MSGCPTRARADAGTLDKRQRLPHHKDGPRRGALTRMVYPRIRYTDLDNLIWKKSEEEASSEAEME
jgi:hypothetical protein